MSHPYHHAVSSSRKYGGKPEDYLHIHNWFDESKKMMADFRHRALRHHAEGIFMAEALFGATLTNSDGRVVPVRFIGEQHVKEDLGFIPSMEEWLKHIQGQGWMYRNAKALSRELEEQESKGAINAAESEEANKEERQVLDVTA